MNQFPTTKELEQFCREHGFLYHAHGSGKWGSERYWSYYKVENNDRTVFSIEYFPVSGTVRISIANNRYQGEVESVAHLLELMAAIKVCEGLYSTSIYEMDVWTLPRRKPNTKNL